MDDMRVLICGSRRDAVSQMERALLHARFGVETASQAGRALDLCMEDIFDCLLLEAEPMFQDIVKTVSMLRDSGVTTPVLIFSERGSKRLTVAALNAGADDVLQRSFTPEELIARVRVLCRRSGGMTMSQLIWGDVSLCSQTYALACGKESVRLSNREYQMMELLMRWRGGTISAEEIAGRIWGWERAVASDVVWVHMSALRKRLRAIGAHVRIETYRGQGYALVCDGAI